MSATISDASHRASGSIACRVTVQLLLRLRGMLTTSNSMPRHSGCRSSANITRRRISSRVAEVLPRFRSRSIRAPSICRRGGRPSSGAIVGADMVNGALILVLARGRNLSDGGAEQPGMAEAIPQTTTAATGPSVRAPLAAAVAISAFTLAVATFELAMADWPSGVVLLAVVPLMALVFCGCALWSATLLLKIRSGGTKFALPFLVCALTLAILVYAPLQQIALEQNFRRHRQDRERIVARVEAGELKPNVSTNKSLI